MMEIYYLKWITSNGISIGKGAYTDKERAEKLVEKGNKRRSWTARFLGGRWVVASLELREGPGKEKS
jgi:hypothetical protein